MLGKLARYLRFLGFDTAYVRGATDGEVVDRARREGRTLVTRDVRLADAFVPSVLLRSPYVADQLRTLHDRFPALDWQVRFDRCTVCNGELRLTVAPVAWTEGTPRPRADPMPEVFECTVCAHRYWEGSHTAAVRRDLQRWLQGPGGA